MWNYGADRPRPMWREGQEVWPVGNPGEKLQVRQRTYDPIGRHWWYSTTDDRVWREGQLDGEYLNGVRRSF